MFTATRQARGAKTVYRFFRDGVELESMTSKVADYGFVHVQGWEHTDKVAARWSRKPKAVGAKIEYGRCIACVPVVLSDYQRGWEAAQGGAMRAAYRGESPEFWRGWNDARTDQPYRDAKECAR